MLPRCSWIHERREQLLSDFGVVLEEGPNRSLRCRLVASSMEALEEGAHAKYGWGSPVRPHPDGKRWTREVEFGSGDGAKLLAASVRPPPTKSAPEGSRRHLVTERPSDVDLAALRWAILTERSDGSPPKRTLLLADPDSREAVSEYISDLIPDNIDELYLRVLRLAVQDVNDSAPCARREARSVAVVLPWTWAGGQAEIERMAMACHYRLLAVGAERVIATLSPLSLQVFSHTALHTASPLLERVAGAFTRWAFIQPQRSRKEEWGRMAAVNLSTIQQSRDLFSAFESPSFSLTKDDHPVRAVMSEAASLLVLEERDNQTVSACDLAAGAPVWTISRGTYS